MRVKHSFLVLLMQGKGNEDAVKMQLHFIFEYPTQEDSNGTRSPPSRFRRHPARKQPRFHIKAYRHTSPDEEWEDVIVTTARPVTVLIKEAITLCQQDMHRRHLVFPNCDTEEKKKHIIGLMDSYCGGALAPAEFRKRAEEEEEARRRYRAERGPMLVR